MTSEGYDNVVVLYDDNYDDDDAVNDKHDECRDFYRTTINWKAIICVF